MLVLQLVLARGDDVFAEQDQPIGDWNDRDGANIRGRSCHDIATTVNTNCESTAYDEDAIHVQTMSVRTEDAKVPTTATTRSSPART